MAAGPFEELLKNFEVVYNKGDMTAVAELYTTDAVLLAPGANLVVGRPGIAQTLQALIDAGMANLVRLNLESVTPIGDDYAVSHEIGDGLDDAGNVTGRYKGMMVWKKVDGKWLIWRDMFNTRGD